MDTFSEKFKLIALEIIISNNDTKTITMTFFGRFELSWKTWFLFKNQKFQFEGPLDDPQLAINYLMEESSQ